MTKKKIRFTADIDADVLQIVGVLAKQQGRSITQLLEYAVLNEAFSAASKRFGISPENARLPYLDKGHQCVMEQDNMNYSRPDILLNALKTSPKKSK